MKKILPILSAAAIVSLPATASAVLTYGLTTTGGLVSFDTANPAVVTTIGVIAQPGIVDIDFSPVNGRLYGATENGELYIIDTASASATPATQALSTPISGITTIDFNPAADRLRAFGTGDSNYRITPDASAFNNAGLTADQVTIDGTFSDPAVNLVGAAYTNNIDGAPTTALYSIDEAGDNLILHSTAPGSVPAGNFSTVTVVGALGIDAGTLVGFDIGQDGTAYLSNANSLYTVNLGTGATTFAGTVGGTAAPVSLASIAVVAVPEVSAGLLGMLSGTALLLRRRRN